MMYKVSEKIRYFRDKLGMTQTDLAKRLGISRSAVNAWEMSLSTPSLANIVELASIFRVTVDSLLYEDARTLVDITALTNEERELVLRLITCFEAKEKQKT